MANNLEITLARSPIGFERSQGQTARALGLTKRGMTVVRPNNESIRGMVFKIRHLVAVSEVEVAEEAEAK